MRKPKLLLKDSYLSMIKNSEGTRMFRDFFGKIKGKKENLTKGGRCSCALFVSSILHHFNLVETPHLTVDGAVEDMRKCGWAEIKKPREGSVILWETTTHPPHPLAKGGPLKRGHQHLGFYLGNKKAISNDRNKRVPKIHHFTFFQKRKIEKFFWHRKLK